MIFLLYKKTVFFVTAGHQIDGAGKFRIHHFLYTARDMIEEEDYYGTV